MSGRATAASVFRVHLDWIAAYGRAWAGQERADWCGCLDDGSDRRAAQHRATRQWRGHREMLVRVAKESSIATLTEDDLVLECAALGP